MSRRGRSDDATDAPDPAARGGASAFDEAQDLLLAALAEIRGEAPPTAAEPRETPPSARSTPRGPSAPSGTATDGGTGGRRARAGRGSPGPAAPFWDEPTPGPGPGSDPSPDAGGGRRRRVTPRVIPTAEGTRRSRRERPAPAAPSPGSAELDGLTDSLYEDRRRRRARSAGQAPALPPGSQQAGARSGAPVAPESDEDRTWAAPAPVAPVVPVVPVAGDAVADDATGELDPEELAAALAVRDLDDAARARRGTVVDDEVVDLDGLDDLEAAFAEAGTDAAAVAEPLDAWGLDDELDDEPAAAVAGPEPGEGRRAAAVSAGATRGHRSSSGAPGPSGRRRRRTGVVVAALVAAVAVVAAVIVLRPGDGGSPALRTTAAAKFTFAPIATPEGAEVTRTWQLEGTRGTEFVGTLAMRNPTASPLPVTFTETIPKSIAPSAGQIQFEPRPVIVQADPVVRYSVTIAPRSTFEATYRTAVAPEGATRARLEAWARELPTTSTTTSTTVPPTTTSTVPATVAPTVPRPPVTPVPTPTTPVTEPTPVPPTTVPPPPPVVPGRIVLRVSSLGGTGTFDYSGWATLSLTTRGTPNGYAEWSANVDPGLFPFTQTTPAGYTLRGIDCSDRDSGPFEWRSIVNPPTVTFNVQPGETVTCTFTNARQR